jgi:hypothetical protein
MPLPAGVIDREREKFALDGSGDVAVRITGSSAGTEYEDADAVASGQKGTVAMGTDGSNLQFLSTDSAGRLQVDIISGGGSNASVKVDDAAYTAASDSLTVIGGFFTSDAVNSGDVGALKINTNRELATTVENTVDVDIVAQTTGDITIADGGNLISVDDGAGSLTIDNSILSVVGGGTEATAQRVTIANDSTGVLTVDDGGGSLTVDGTVAATQSGTWSSRLQDGSGNTISSTSNALDVNVSSGSLSVTANIEGDYVDDSAFTVASDRGLATGGVFTTDTVNSGDFGVFKINADRELGVFLGEALPTGSNSIGDIGTITNVVSVDDNSGSLTIDNSTLSVTGGGVEASALRVTLANNSTGVLSIDDNGGSITVDGTVAATQSGTWNINDVSGTISLPTGAATETTLSAADTKLGTIDTDTGNIATSTSSADTKLTTTNTKLTDIETNTDALAALTKTTVGADTGLDVNVIQGINVEVDLSAADDSVLVYGYDGSSNQKIKTDSSGNVQTDIVASLPAGANAIGKLVANSGVDIGDVDITSIVTGTGATNLGKAEDAAHSTGDVGIMGLAVRKNTPSSLSGSDGDYQPLITDTNGRLYTNDISTASALSGSEFQVDVIASLPAGTNAIGKLSANSGVDIGDVTLTAGSASIGTLGANSGVDIGDVSINNSSGGSAVNIQDGGNSITVDGAVSATQSGSWTVISRGTRSVYTEVSAGLPQNSIAWNSTASAGVGTKFRLLGVTCKFGGVPTANNFIVSLNSLAAPLVNVNYWVVDPGTLGLTDIAWHPDGEIILDSTIGETLDIIWTNAAAQVDWGLRVVVEEVTP